MALRVSTVDSDVLISDLGIWITHPTINRDLSLEFTALELKESSDLTEAIQAGNLDVDDGTHFIHQDDYDPDELLIQELGYNRDELYISHDELASKADILINKTGVFPLSLSSTASSSRNIYSPAARFITWQLAIGDIVVIPLGNAAGTYTVESVTDQQNFVVVESIVDSTGGTCNIYHPGGATRIGINESNFSVIEGTTLQDVLEDIDSRFTISGFEDQLVKVTSNDTVSSYLNNKIQAGKNITTQEINDGGNEQLRINSSCYEDLVYEPTGFTNDVRSTIDFNDSTRTFTIEPISTSFEYYIKGVEYSKTSAESVIISNTEGGWFIYYDGATLSASQSPWNLSQHVPVAFLYWDSSNEKNILFCEERHKLTMDWATHQRLHFAVGAVVEKETLDLINYTTSGDGSEDYHAQVGFEDGNLYDEDLVHSIIHADTPSGIFEQELRTYAKIPLFYKEGTDADWRKLDATDYPLVHASPSLVKYNKYDTISGLWLLESCNEDYYVTTWICATNNIYEPVIGIVGQTQSIHSFDAALEDFEDIVDGLPFTEFSLLDKLTFKTSSSYTNIPKAILYSTEKESLSRGTYTIIGALTKMTFGYNSTAGDRWLDYEYYNVNSYDVPGIIQYRSEIRSVSFSNSNSNADVDIEFYVNGTSASHKVYTLEVRGKSWVYDSDIVPIILNAGDTVRCYIKKNSVAAQSPIIQFEGKVVDETISSGSG